MLPQLSPPEAELLTAFITCRGDLHALLSTTGCSAADLLAWHQSPNVQEHLAALKALAADALEIRSAQARTVALATLESIARSSTDPIEQRRAATGIANLSAKPRAPRPAQEPELPEQEPEPNPVIEPRAAPSPERDPKAVAQIIASALMHPSDPAWLRTLHAHLAPGAVLATEPAPADPDEFASVAAELLKHRSTEEIVQIFINASDFSTQDSPLYRISIIQRNNESSSYLVRLTRSPSGWLIFWIPAPLRREQDPRHAGGEGDPAADDD